MDVPQANFTSPMLTIPPAPLPQTHIGLTQRSWQWIRVGLARCQANPDERQQCLEWCRKFPDSTQTWIEILQGIHPQMVALVFRIENYADLPPEAKAWWENVVQNHPFAALFAPERYAALVARRKAQSG